MAIPEMIERQARKEFFKAVGRYLHSKREKAGLTQFQVAQISGYTPQFISNIECGAAFPPSPLLTKMIETYRIPQDEFMMTVMNFQMDFYKQVYFPQKKRKRG
ncbi:MAG: helix-turn-helix transcriptional regulator [Oligoflexia bacterium]|nr:helix-turn-helix transcriptional regulator [Oligoflexia bacterium]